MGVTSIAGGGSGNTGALSADTVFYVETGRVSFSTDTGATKIPFSSGEKVIFSSGLTVHYFNEQPITASFSSMAI